MADRDAAILDPPTPSYVYDLAELRARHDALVANLPRPSRLYYALKANPHPDLVAALVERGAGAEVSSPGELDVALRSGAAPGGVLYTGPAKRDQDVRAALAAGVRTFSLDSARGAAQLARLAAAAGVSTRYLLRVNPEPVRAAAGLAMTGVPSQFGVDEAAIAADPAAFVAHPAAILGGLHLYLATNLADTDALMAQFEVALATAKRLEAVLGVRFATLDLGGGFAAPYATAGVAPEPAGLAERLGTSLDGTFPGWRAGAPEIVFESGRALVATCGELLTRVLDVKRTHGRRVVVVDSGIHHLGGMAGLRRVPPLRPHVRTDAVVDEPSEPARVCGSLCTPLDTWAGEHPLPDVAPGDLLSVPNVGAYGLTASLALFLSHRPPVEIVRDGGRVVTATRLETRRRPVALAESTHDPVTALADPSRRPSTRGACEMDEKFTAVLHTHLPFLPEGRPLRPDDELRDLGLNSMAAIELLFAVEDAYGVAIPDEMLGDTIFATVGSLWSALGTARAQAGAA